jgi:hypothetical protein
MVMNRFFDLLDRFKYGLIATVAAYVGLFMYLEMESYTKFEMIEPFTDGSYIDIPKEEVELNPDNILIPSDYSGEMSNVARDVNDKRRQSDEKWYANKSAGDIEKSVREEERRMFEEAGGAKERQRIQQEIDQRKKDRANAAKANNPNSNSNSGDVAVKGSVAAEWQLDGRNPHQNNEWWIRKPSYLCESSGSVLIYIKVNQNGDVIEARVDAAKSSTDGCLIRYATEYARKSRFNFSSAASASQSGYIRYTFVGQ